jgi:hypothetical protein
LFIALVISSSVTKLQFITGKPFGWQDIHKYSPTQHRYISEQNKRGYLGYVPLFSDR